MQQVVAVVVGGGGVCGGGCGCGGGGGGGGCGGGGWSATPVRYASMACRTRPCSVLVADLLVLLCVSCVCGVQGCWCSCE